MRVAVCSIFRNSAHYMERYFDQLLPLRDRYELVASLTEGDSTDGTKDFVWAWNSTSPCDWQFQTVDHGGPHYGSVDHPHRWDLIAQVVRPTIAHALDMKPDLVLWVESDLVWDTETMTQLIDRTAAGPNRTSAPMLLAGHTPRFYDTWGYRLGGQMFLGHPPYLPENADHFREPGNPLVHIDSCGSCFVTNDLAGIAQWDGVWPYWAPGTGNIKLHTDLVVRHPE